MLQIFCIDGLNWRSLLFGSEYESFLYTVVVRAVVMFIVVLTSLRILGKRGVKQLSVFELVIILTLGSAAGDPMLYKEVGLLDSIAVFIMIVLLYRLTVFMAARYHGFTMMIKGKPVYLMSEGKFLWDNFRGQPIAFDEFFAELRLRGVSQLGQVQTAILETSGEISLFFFPDEQVRWGLSIYPGTVAKPFKTITEEDFYACVRCAESGLLKQGAHDCPKCGNNSWAKASNERRVP